MPIDLARTPAFGARTFVAPLLAALLALGFARSANAQTHDLMEGRGRDVSLPVSCGADIQPRFDAALAALHSFWYGQALKEFTAITEAKPDCAMAYWGIAMTAWTQIWAPPTPASLKTGSEAIARALALGGTTPRERDYLEALAAFYADHDKLDHRTRASAYMRKMEGLAQRYPDERASSTRCRCSRPQTASTRPTRISCKPAPFSSRFLRKSRSTRARATTSFTPTIIRRWSSARSRRRRTTRRV